MPADSILFVIISISASLTRPKEGLFEGKDIEGCMDWLAVGSTQSLGLNFFLLMVVEGKQG